MDIDGQKILEELAKRPDRERVSLYLSKSLYRDFTKSCGNIAPSKVMEVLMKRFIDSLPKKSSED